MLRLGGGAGRQRDVTASLLPIKRLVLSDDPLLHAVLEHRHQQLQNHQDRKPAQAAGVLFQIQGSWF